MAKKKSPKVRKPLDADRARAIRGVLIRSLVTITLVIGAGAGYWYLQRYVRTQVAYSPQPPKVVLVNRPVWMSDGLADLIARHVRPAVGQSALDHQMLRDRVAILKNEPWIKQVKQVRRVYGQAPGDTLEIDCDYRAPIALVRWDDKYVLVDGDGVVLPERIGKPDVPKIVYGKNGRMNIRLIEGVSRRPPADGQRWLGDDLSAGIWMVKTLYGKGFAEEIMSVDVANYGGRENGNDPHLILVTRYGSEIRWGQSHNWRGFEASIDRKLSNLEQVFHQYGRIDANEPWLDLRFDKVLRPDPQAHSASATIER
jgi:hypothetical protein